MRVNGMVWDDGEGYWIMESLAWEERAVQDCSRGEVFDQCAFVLSDRVMWWEQNSRCE